MKAKDTLRVGGQEYHVVAAVLMMLGLLESYLQFQDVVPTFGGEVAHRVVELLKVGAASVLPVAFPANILQPTKSVEKSQSMHLVYIASCVC